MSQWSDERGAPFATRPPFAPVVSTAVTALTLLVAFGLMALGIEHFWIAFVVGFGGVLPASVAMSKRFRTEGGRSSPSRRGDDAETALEELRVRYARGELTDAEFERRVERLLESSSDPGRLSVGSPGTDRSDARGGSSEHSGRR